MVKGGCKWGCLLGLGMEGLGFCKVWAQKDQGTWHLLCKCTMGAEGVCAGLWEIHLVELAQTWGSAIIH